MIETATVEPALLKTCDQIEVESAGSWVAVNFSVYWRAPPDAAEANDVKSESAAALSIEHLEMSV